MGTRNRRKNSVIQERKRKRRKKEVQENKTAANKIKKAESTAKPMDKPRLISPSPPSRMENLLGWMTMSLIKILLESGGRRSD